MGVVDGAEARHPHFHGDQRGVFLLLVLVSF